MFKFSAHLSFKRNMFSKTAVILRVTTKQLFILQKQGGANPHGKGIGTICSLSTLDFEFFLPHDCRVYCNLISNITTIQIVYIVTTVATDRQ
jgi:hypothetical protein